MRDTLNIGGYYNNEDSHCGLMGYNTLYSGNWLELVPDSSNIQNRSHNMKIIYIYKKKIMCCLGTKVCIVSIAEIT
jgi:hypothetical protein